MESDPQLYVNDFINQKTIMANYPWVLSTITVLWEFCDSGELCSRRYNRSSSPPANIQGLQIFDVPRHKTPSTTGRDFFLLTSNIGEVRN
ncbi:hypothetical protein AAC387_Pa03g1082 [Persea americana]